MTCESERGKSEAVDMGIKNDPIGQVLCSHRLTSDYGRIWQMSNSYLVSASDCAYLAIRGKASSNARDYFMPRLAFFKQYVKFIVVTLRSVTYVS